MVCKSAVVSVSLNSFLAKERSFLTNGSTCKLAQKRYEYKQVEEQQATYDRSLDCSHHNAPSSAGFGREKTIGTCKISCIARIIVEANIKLRSHF